MPLNFDILHISMTKTVADYYTFTISNYRKIKIVRRISYRIFVHKCLVVCSILPAVCWYGFILPIYFKITPLMARESYGQTLTVKQPWRMWKTHWTTPRRTDDINTNNITTAIALITRFMGLTWGPSGAERTQVGPMNWVYYMLSQITRIFGLGSTSFDPTVHVRSIFDPKLFAP